MSEGVVRGFWMRDAVNGDVADYSVDETLKSALSKVPEVMLGFWIIKILATTLGETGDILSMSLNLGYALSTVILFVPFLVLVVAQVRAQRFHAFLYWGVIVDTTLAGTTMADFADRSLGTVLGDWTSEGTCGWRYEPEPICRDGRDRRIDDRLHYDLSARGGRTSRARRKNVVLL